MIFYFTATGNSKYIADTIADATGDHTINISGCVQNRQYAFELADDESLGFVVPVYYFGIPIIVEDFLEKFTLSAKHDFYSYAVLNCGGSTGNAERFISRAIRIDAVFGVRTVENYVPMMDIVPEAEIKEKLDNAEKHIGTIADRINNRDTGIYNDVAGRLPRFVCSFAYSIYKRGRKTNKFKVSEKCTSCGLCKNICPRQIIEIVGGKPEWRASQCELCLGCLHRCPAASIDYGKSVGRGRYINPRVEW